MVKSILHIPTTLDSFHIFMLYLFSESSSIFLVNTVLVAPWEITTHLKCHFLRGVFTDLQNRL